MYEREETQQVNYSFDISIGKKEFGRLSNEKQIGHAHYFKENGKNYYSLRIWAPVPLEYYLCSTQNNPNKYVLFAKKTIDEDETKFLCPVGWGVLSGELKTHIEVQFNFPRTKVFISLYPSNK